MNDTLSITHFSDGDLSLELIADKHATSLFDLVSSNREHLRAWLPWVDSMKTVEDFQNYIYQCQQQHQAGSDYGYVISYNLQLIGRIGIHYINHQNKSGAIGYWIGKEWEGKGIITRACVALLQNCFTDLQLNRIEIRCGTGNQKSAAIPERLCFTKEGVLRQAEWVNGRFHDLALYSLLKEEWHKGLANAAARLV